MEEQKSQQPVVEQPLVAENDTEPETIAVNEVAVPGLCDTDLRELSFRKHKIICLANYWSYCCKTCCWACCWPCVARQIGRWLQMGKVVDNYKPVVYLYWVLYVVGIACFCLGLVDVGLGVTSVQYFVSFLVFAYIWQQRRAWVTRFNTGESCCVSCLITCFCWPCNYGQMGGHKDSRRKQRHKYVLSEV